MSDAMSDLLGEAMSDLIGEAKIDAMKDSVESLVRTVWSKSLGVPHPAANENFFDLGGDSLMLLNAHAELERGLGRKFPLNALFEFTTMRALTSYLMNVPQAESSLSEAADRARRQREAALRNRAVRMETR